MSAIDCPTCDLSIKYDKTKLRLSVEKVITCPLCGAKISPWKKAKPGRTDSQRRSQQQEKRAAARYGAKKQPGSGSLGGAKGDIIDPGNLRGECKETTNKSYSLKLADLMKIEKEAGGFETPLFEIQFQGVHPYKTYAVLPAQTYASLLEELKTLREDK